MNREGLFYAAKGSPTWRRGNFVPAGRKLSVYERVVTGRVREPTYRYKLRAALSGGIAARVNWRPLRAYSIIEAFTHL